jgi:hypothetical protein
MRGCPTTNVSLVMTNFPGRHSGPGKYKRNHAYRFCKQDTNMELEMIIFQVHARTNYPNDYFI